MQQFSIRWRKEKIRYVKGAGGPGAPTTLWAKIKVLKKAPATWYSDKNRRSRYSTIRGVGGTSRQAGRIRDFGKNRYGDVHKVNKRY